MPDHDYNEDYSDSLDRPSKTQQKAAMHALRDLGSELVELSPGQLKRMDLPQPSVTPRKSPLTVRAAASCNTSANSCATSTKPPSMPG